MIFEFSNVDYFKYHGFIIPQTTLWYLITGLPTYHGHSYENLFFWKCLLLDWTIAGFDQEDYYELIGRKSAELLRVWYKELPCLRKTATTWEELGYATFWTRDKHDDSKMLQLIKLKCEMALSVTTKEAGS